MKVNHNLPTAGHLGVQRTYDSIRGNYYFDKMYKKVEEFVRCCEDCHMRKRPPIRHKAHLIPIQPPSKAFDVVQSDCVGPLPQTKNGNKYIVVFTDMLTRYAHVYAVPNVQSYVIAKLLYDEIICRHGIFRVLQTDGGSNYNSKLINHLYKICNIKKQTSTVYRPQTQGLPERLNSTLVTALGKFVNDSETDWDEYLNSFTFAYITLPQESTGYSPHYM